MSSCLVKVYVLLGVECDFRADKRMYDIVLLKYVFEYARNQFRNRD